MTNGKKIFVLLTFSRYQWHEIALFITCVVLAGLYFFNMPAHADGVSRLVRWQMHIWFALQGAGGVIGLVGVFAMTRRIDLALKIEQAGLLLVTAAGLMYGSLLVTAARGGVGTVMAATLVFLMWVGASIGRSWQIRGELRHIRRENP